MPRAQDITESTINTLTLHANRKAIIKERYLAVLGEYQRRACRYGRSFHWSRITVAVGSLLVPALLSIQYIPGTGSAGASSGAAANAIVLYWVTWVISLLVTVANGVATLMKVDKKYYFLNTIVEQLRSEGWQYVSLTGRYSGAAESMRTHEYQFLYFCHMVEKIKMHQVEEEYFKLTDEYNKGSGAATSGSGSGSSAAATTAMRALTTGALQPPTPQQPLEAVLARLPTDLRIDIENLLAGRGATGPTGQ